MTSDSSPEDLVQFTLVALRDERGFAPRLDALPVPIYVTDAEGAVTYWNQACVAFAGREPQLGTDRWCVTWQLYTMAGEPLDHADCPMAQAIRERRAIRDVIAIAERPDGKRVAFRPYPTPLFDESGQFVGAVNLLIDISAEQVAALTDQAARCRRLADATHDRRASQVLGEMADTYEETVASLRGAAHSPLVIESKA